MSEEDLGDARAVRELKREANIKAAARRLTLKRLMADPEGREWLWDVLSMCGLYVNAFSSDPVRMAFNCGMQNVGQRLLADITEAAPELYLAMQQEKMKGQVDEVPDAFELQPVSGE